MHNKVEGVCAHDALNDVDPDNFSFEDLLKPCPDMTYFKNNRMNFDELGKRIQKDLYSLIGNTNSLISHDACMSKNQYKQLLIKFREYFNHSDAYENHIDMSKRMDVEIKIATWVNSCRLQCGNCLNEECGHRIESETQK